MPSSPEFAATPTPIDASVETWLPRELRNGLIVAVTTRSDDNVVHAAQLFELAGRSSIPAGVLDSERGAARAAGYAAGWDAGLRAARLAADTEVARERADADRAAQVLNVQRAQAVRAVHAAASQLEQRAATSLEETEDLIVSSAFAIAEALVAAPLRDDTARGASAVRRALSLAPSGEAVLIALNPVDHATLTADGTAPLGDPDHSIQLVPDPRLAPGDAIATCGATTIDARLSTGLERVRAVLAR